MENPTISIEQEIQKSYLEYSLSVIIGRAIPDVRDGLKPVHRRILYAQSELGNTYNRAYKKSARVVGDVIGKYHPHGDSAVYDALVRMAQEFSMRDPLVDGQGNFGSIDGDSAAAMRYTEARMSRLAGEFLSDIEKNTVDFRPNYDNSLKEPEVLPTKVPNLLLNGSSGIAVGMATNIPPHNLGELCDALLHMLREPAASSQDLMAFVKGPDFPTGGTVYVGRGLTEAYTTGRGSVKIRGKLHVEERGKNLESIVVTEIPYAVNKANLVEKIAMLVHEKRLEGISDLRDESDRKGIRIVIDLKRGVIPSIVINTLYKYTALETSFGYNMMAVVDNRPQLLTLKGILQHFLSHRREVIIRRTRFDLAKAEARAHILKGLRIALDNIDEVVQIIKASKTPQDAKTALGERFGLDDVQSQAILDMRLQRLTNLEQEKLIDEYNALLEKIAYFKSILENESVLLGVIREEIEDLKSSYATPRRSEIDDRDLSGIDIEDLIPDNEVVITLSRRGYIKRTDLENYSAQRRGGKGIFGVHTSDGDFILNFLVTSNHQYLLLFTNRGKMHRLKVHQIPEGSRTAKGMHIANLLQLEKDEYVTAALCVRDFMADRAFLFVTKKGMVKRTMQQLYTNCRSTGIIAVNVREDDDLLQVVDVSNDDEMVLVTKDGYSIRFRMQDARPMGRGTAGVKGIALRDGDEVVSGVVVTPEESKDILTVSEKGYGKRSSLDLYRLQTRGGKGIITMKTTHKTGALLGAIMVDLEDDIIMLTTENKVIRMNAGEIRKVGRATQGVRLVSMNDEGSVAGFDLVRDRQIEEARKNED
ncbi:DNA gyrase subunit A [Desulfobaculum bizertense]|uniref:DNA gyrase subunit A n=1 Tax=Desulfobaculum bizertense DSM 18034 TaxID=1121442 RepID=A0A1T4X325_9BACT|nr:DNA gyrase subunit A [Desulfobaculum bizertense]UIJ37377.1 DNA gyrase subunit A [Desulfobaculum bizertense]SKA83568.1 DNA gyrase subunit A [Desulfobaculum bizertense DSM 18034]